MRALAAVAFYLALAAPLTAQITARFYLNKDSYSVGEPLMFTMEVKNQTPDTIYLFPKPSGKCSDLFTFSMNGPGMLCETRFETECTDDTVDVKAGDTYTAQWPLDFWYRIDHEGKWDVTISRKTHYTGLKTGVRSLDFSSQLQLNVVPGDPAQVEEVLRKFQADLQSPDPNVRHDALDVLATTAPDYFHDETMRLAREEDAFYVEHAVGALSRMNTPETRAMLAEIITTRKIDSDSEEAARCHAIEGLGMSGDASYLAMLVPYADHTNTPCEGELAMQAMARLGRGSAVPQLQTYLHSQDPKQRLYAVEALRITSAPEAVDPLIGALRDKDADVRAKAAASLSELTGHSIVKPGQPSPGPIQLENLWRTWWHNHQQTAKMVEYPPMICRMP